MLIWRQLRWHRDADWLPLIAGSGSILAWQSKYWINAQLAYCGLAVVNSVIRSRAFLYQQRAYFFFSASFSASGDVLTETAHFLLRRVFLKLRCVIKSIN